MERIRTADGARLLCDADATPTLEEWLAREGTLFAAAAVHPERERLMGRGIVHVVPRPDGNERWVVRHYLRGGAVASVLGDRYLRLGRPRPVRELSASRALESAGVPTPHAVAAAWYPSGPTYRGDLVTRWVPDSRDLAAVLFPDHGGGAGDDHGGRSSAEVPDRAAAMEAAGRLIRLAHEAGLRHPDLNLKNILIVDSPDGPVAQVVDLDRARVGGPVGDGGRQRMLRRFWRSARKFERRSGRALGREARAAFEAGYRG